MCLECAANIAQVVTAATTFGASTWYFVTRWRRKRMVEHYLRRNAAGLSPSGKRRYKSVLTLVSKLDMTEPQLFEASFHSAHIRRAIRKGSDGLATHILFCYEEIVNASD